VFIDEKIVRPIERHKAPTRSVELLTAKADRTDEQLARTDQQIDRMSEGIDVLVQSVRELVGMVRVHESRIGHLEGV
jgi:hypothetical protein